MIGPMCALHATFSQDSTPNSIPSALPCVHLLKLSPPRPCAMSSLYTRLWAHFLAHTPVRRWLFHPCSSLPQQPLSHRAIARSLAFVCDFPIPVSLAASAASFALGELLVPVKTYGRFILGFIVAASPHHKVAASLTSKPSQSSIIVRTVVVDPGSREDDPLLLLDFAWLQDHSVIVAAKQFPPVKSDLPITGVLAFYSNSKDLSKPHAVTTFVENARRNPLQNTITEAPPESALSVAKRAAAAQKKRFKLLCFDSEEARPRLATAAKRLYSISAAGSITVSIRIAEMAPDGRFVLANNATNRQLYADFHVPTEAQLTSLRQVASLSASFNQPNNTASTTLLTSSSPSSSINNSIAPISAHSASYPRNSNNDIDRNHSGLSGDILAALADAERATTDTEVCSPPSNTSAGPIIAATAATPHNVEKFIESVSPPPAVPTPLHPLPHPGALALPPSYTSVKSAHSIHHPTTAPATHGNVYPFDYSPVSYSSTDALAAVVNATDRVIDRTMFDKFFPANSHAQPTPNITIHTPSPLPPQSQAIAVSTAPLAVPPQSAHNQSHPLAIHSQPLPTQSHALPVHVPTQQTQALPVPSQPLPIPPQTQPLSIPTSVPTSTRGTEVRTTKRSRSSSGVCTECGKCFFKSGALARHMRHAHPAAPRTMQSAASNSEAERLDCPRCDKTFSQQGSLNRHLRSIHEARKLHCRYCTLAFGQAFDLKRHQRRKHPGRATAVPREALPAIVLRGRARAISAQPSVLH